MGQDITRGLQLKANEDLTNTANDAGELKNEKLMKREFVLPIVPTAVHKRFLSNFWPVILLQPLDGSYS